MSGQPGLIELQFIDMTGQLRSIDIDTERFKNAIKLGKIVDGSSINMKPLEKSDLLLKPIMETYFQLPWNSDVARVLCDMYEPAEKVEDFGKEKEFEISPRYALKKMIKRIEEKGYSFHTSSEMEFFAITENRPYDRAGYMAPPPMDKIASLRREIVKTLSKVNIQGEYTHHEVSTGQYEICFRHNEALKTADNVMTFKYIAKNLASMQNLTLSLMPKPYTGINGSGMHIHMSLFDSEGTENLFFGGGELLSKLAIHFMGGILKHARAISALAASTVNSYKRLLAGYEAPVYVCWGYMNRSALIRIQSFNSPQLARIELRMPDPCCNPYLVFAAILAAGLWGISEKVDPGAPWDKNAYFHHEGLEVIPATLKEALDELEKDKLIREALGSSLMDHYLKIKRKEWNEYQKLYPEWNPNEITEWERNKYLDFF
jgi:glutamine synthetase